MRIEGSTQYVETTGAWFRARLTIPEAPRAAGNDAPGGQVNLSPTLMYELLDSEGQVVDLSINERLEVDSVDLGRRMYEIEANPEPIRKRRRVIGFQATLRRVEVRQADRQIQERAPVGATRVLGVSQA